MTAAKTFDTLAVFICDTDKFASAATGTDRENKTWNRPFRQSLDILIQS